MAAGPLPTQPADRPGVILAQGVCRYLIDLGFAPVAEFSPARGLRTDVTALGPKGEIWVVECKSSRADFQSDAKWGGYLEWADAFFFATPADFPVDILPLGEGLLVADGHGAEEVRAPQARPLAAARRKALTQRLTRAAALRLRALIDPGLRSFDIDI
jgi:hypothetical protein